MDDAAPDAAHEDAASGSDASMQPDNGAPAPEAGPMDAGASTDAPTAGGVNLVTNGDFSQGDMYWLVLLNLDAGVDTVANGALCVMTSTTSSITVGYPTDLSKAFSILAGTKYTLSYTAWSSPSAMTIGAKIGQVQKPFTADFTANNEALSLNAQMFSHTFTAANPDPQAGVVFMMNSQLGGTTNQVCFANVSVTVAM